MQATKPQDEKSEQHPATRGPKRRHEEMMAVSSEAKTFAADKAWNSGSSMLHGDHGQLDQSVLETPSNQAPTTESELSGRRTHVQSSRMLLSEFSVMDGSSPYSKALAADCSSTTKASEQQMPGGNVMAEVRLEAAFQEEEEQAKQAKGPRIRAPLTCCDETGLTALRRAGSRPLKVGFKALDELLGKGLTYPSAMEVLGSSCAGKTEFMLNVCCEGVLPEEFGDVWVGGNEASFVFCCLGSTSSHHVTRLVSLFDLHARRIQPQAPGGWVKGFVLDCLSRIHFVVCESKLELLCSMRSMGDLLGSVPGVRGVIFDSLSIFQWSDKAEGKVDSELPQRLWDATFHSLQQLAARHDLVVFASRWHQARPKEPGHAQPNDQHSMYLGKRWNNMITHRLWLSCSQGRGKPEYSAVLKRIGEQGAGRRVEMVGIETETASSHPAA